MGKTFVEDERPCDQCVNRTRYGCASWDCKFIDRDEAIKAWKEKHEMADRKTENSSEKPNNCEELNAYRECVKSRSFWDSKHCDGCYFDERCPFDEPKDEPTISKMEQVAKDINVRSKDEPQTNADQHVQHVGSVESVEPTWTKEEHEAFYTFLWNVINPNEMQDYIEMFETKDEPQTERRSE